MPALDIAILLCTYNGAQFIEPQIRSLAENASRFTLHWLDDQSTDDTASLVPEVAKQHRVDLQSWKMPRSGVPASFFSLMEYVDADIYLFCDQDDIWQAGKVDATVDFLSRRADVPTLCYSEPWVFNTASPEQRHRYFDLIRVNRSRLQEPCRAFIVNPAVGNTVGFNRALHRLFLEGIDLAKQSAIMHDWWMYLLATAFGHVQFMEGIPTTLYRQHERNVAGVGRRSKTLRSFFRRIQSDRLSLARQARGFIAATEAELANTPLRDVAHLVSQCDDRQSLTRMSRMIISGATPVPWWRGLSFASACVMSSATDHGR